MKRVKVKSKQVILSLVCLVLGFILAFSYSLANSKEDEGSNRTDGQLKQEEALRDQILDFQRKNNELQEDLYEKQEKVVTMEKNPFQRKSRFILIWPKMQSDTGCT